MKLEDAQVRARLADLPSWTFLPERGGRLWREFLFDDFVATFGFMSQLALHAERMGHHAEWSNVYNRVDVTLTTHDVSGLSGKDLEMAMVMDRTAADLGARSL